MSSTLPYTYLLVNNTKLIFTTDSENPAYAVVQFLLFGSDERYNSMHSYEQLKELSEEYLQSVE